MPAIASLHERFDVPLSVDTWRASVAAAAFDAGAVLGNDISGFADPRLPPGLPPEPEPAWWPPTSASRLGCPTPSRTTTTSSPRSSASSSNAPRRALANGIPADRIILDAGLDLGKTAAQSLAAAAELGRARLARLPAALVLLEQDLPRSPARARHRGTPQRLFGIGGPRHRRRLPARPRPRRRRHLQGSRPAASHHGVGASGRDWRDRLEARADLRQGAGRPRALRVNRHEHLAGPDSRLRRKGHRAGPRRPWPRSAPRASSHRRTAPLRRTGGGRDGRRSRSRSRSTACRHLRTATRACIGAVHRCLVHARVPGRPAHRRAARLREPRRRPGGRARLASRRVVRAERARAGASSAKALPAALAKAVKAHGREIETSPGPSGKARTQWLSEQLQLAPVHLEPAARQLLERHLGRGLITLAPALGRSRGGIRRGRPGDAGRPGAVPRRRRSGPALGSHRRPRQRRRERPPCGWRTACSAPEAATPSSCWQPCTGTTGRCSAWTGAASPIPSAAAALLGMSPFPAQKVLAQARRLGPERVARAISLIADADLDLRGVIDWPDELVIEVLVARLAQLVSLRGGPPAAPSRRAP